MRAVEVVVPSDSSDSSDAFLKNMIQCALKTSGLPSCGCNVFRGAALTGNPCGLVGVVRTDTQAAVEQMSQRAYAQDHCRDQRHNPDRT